MATIHHVAAWVCDLEAQRDFYLGLFGGTATTVYRNQARGFRSCFLAFGAGARLELMTVVGLAASPAQPATGLAHLAFGAGTSADVDAFARRLREAGRAVENGPRRTGDGFYELVFRDPEGNLVEVVADAGDAGG